MRTIWGVIITLAVLWALVSGNGAKAGEALLGAGQAALRLMLPLAGSLILWSGLMEILRQAGDVERLGRLVRRVLRPLFPGIASEAAWSAMSANLAANMLGLGNAATPAGIEAARLLTAPGMGECGVRGLVTLLVLNNSGLELMPTTVMALRASCGAASPADIWLPSLLSSGAATVMACVLTVLVYGRRRKRGGGGTNGGAARGGADRAAGDGGSGRV